MSSPQSNWDSRRALFEAALQLPPAERSAFLRSQTVNDEATRREIESLLAAHEEGAAFLTESQGGAVRPDESVINAGRLTAGTRLGAYEIVERLGSGGMGEVYRGRDTRLNRFVAIEVLSEELELVPGADSGSNARRTRFRSSSHPILHRS